MRIESGEIIIIKKNRDREVEVNKESRKGKEEGRRKCATGWWETLGKVKEGVGDARKRWETGEEGSRYITAINMFYFVFKLLRPMAEYESGA